MWCRLYADLPSLLPYEKVSSGFDAGAMDPLSHQMLSSSTFGLLAEKMCTVCVMVVSEGEDCDTRLQSMHFHMVTRRHHCTFYYAVNMCLICMYTTSKNSLLCPSLQVAEEFCDGAIVFCHEGGYNPAQTPFCGLRVVEALTRVKTNVQCPFDYEVCAASCA